MSYTVVIERDAVRALARIPNPDYARIAAAINALANDPRPPGSKSSLVDFHGAFVLATTK